MAGVTRRLYIGTYTRRTGSRGIYTARFDPVTGTFSKLRLAARAANPSFLVRTGDRLLAVNEALQRGSEDGNGTLSVYRIGWRLGRRQRVATGGAGPCHLGVAGNRVAVANYHGGTVALFEWQNGRIGDIVAVHRHVAGGPHPRQQRAHPHAVVFVGDELWVPDLGGDRVYRYHAITGAALGEIVAPPATGPRHLTSRGDYLVGELDNRLHAIRDATITDSASTLPPAWDGENTAAAIASGPADTVYVSNRGHDSIAVFETAAALRCVQHQPCGGRHPRHIVLDPDGKWLLVANMESNNVVVLPVGESGRLGDPVAELACPAPTCLCW